MVIRSGWDSSISGRKEYIVCCLITLAEYMIKLNRCITYVYSNKVNCYQKSRSISIPEYIIINKIKKLHVYAVIFLLQNTCIIVQNNHFWSVCISVNIFKSEDIIQSIRSKIFSGSCTMLNCNFLRNVLENYRKCQKIKMDDQNVQMF